MNKEIYFTITNLDNRYLLEVDDSIKTTYSNLDDLVDGIEQEIKNNL